MLGVAQIEAADPTDQQVGDDKIEEAPQHIDQCGGQADSRWRCEGALERVSRNPIAKMGQRVRKECAPEEIPQIMVPTHGCPPSNCKEMLAIFARIPTVMLVRLANITMGRT